MRVSRRWSEEDVKHLTERQYGLVSVPPPPLSPEAAQLRLANIRARNRKLEVLLDQQLQLCGLRSLFATQYPFDPHRRWRLDFYAREYRVGLEVHGGTHSEGRHVRGNGFHDDRVKINAAAMSGIAVLEFTSAMLQDGTAIAQTERLLMARGWVKP